MLSMKTYFRLLNFSRPLADFIPLYLLFSIMSIVFGLLNFGLLIPLLDILFQSGSTTKATLPIDPGPFVLSGDWITAKFQYYFLLQAQSGGQLSALYFVCGFLIVSVALSNIFRYVSQVMVENLRARALRNVRNAVFDKAMSLHLGYFSNARKGDLMARITTDVQEVDYSVANTFATLLKEPITIIAYILILLWISPQLTLFAFIIIPVSAIIIAGVGKRLKKDSKEAMNLSGQLLSLTEEALGAIRIIKSFNAQEFIKARFHSQTENYKQVAGSINRRKEAASPFSEFSGVTVVAILLGYGGSLVLSGDSSLSASQFVAYLTLFSQVMRPAKSLSNSFGNIYKGLAAGERIFAIIDAKEEVTAPLNGTKLTTFETAIDFKNVSFSYGERDVLQNLSFHLPKGGSIALVGPSGGGKSTIADLLLRFYDPQLGQILIDGTPLPLYDINSVRSHIGLVSQDTVLFNDTVFANIAFCKPDATEAEVHQAATIAHAHEFVMQLPDGYQTMIGDRGSRLSGGQRQRLSIARAVLMNPQILILDEATSALDSESERLVQDALNTLLHGRTSIMIAHRLSTIRQADQILVIDGGKIIEQGTHASLMQEGDSMYRKLASMQGDSVSA